jgi:hypothetical protein
LTQLSTRLVRTPEDLGVSAEARHWLAEQSRTVSFLDDCGSLDLAGDSIKNPTTDRSALLLPGVFLILSNLAISRLLLL